MLIKQVIDNIFNNPPVSVDAPREYKMHYSDVGTRVEAYIVRVKYKNGKSRDFTFSIDNDHWKIVSAEKAYNRALRFYSRKFTQMLKREAKTK